MVKAAGFIAVRGRDAEVYQEQGDAPQASITRFAVSGAVLNYRGFAGVCGSP